MQESDPTSPDQASEVVQRSERLFGNQAGGEHGVAKMLREAREGKGEEISQISERLRIRAAYLQAIEEGRCRDLPGDAYAIGFVRAYAYHLGLDGEETVRRFKKEASVSGKTTSLVFPIPAREARAPKGLVLLFSVLLALTVYGAWYAISYRSETLVQPVLVEEQAPAISPPVIEEPATVAVEEQVDEEPTAESVASVTSETEIAPASSEEPALPASSETAPLPEAALPEEPVSAQNAPVEGSISTMIVLRGKSDTWIEIRDETGQSMMAGVLHENEIYRPPLQSGLTLAVGDASGIEILVGGQAIPPLGGSGAVLRRVLLDPTRLKAGSAVRD